jgi:tetratricopeptide (TPR) repeat protein
MGRGRAGWLAVAAAGLLGGCATHGPLLDRGDMPVELVDTPFYPQSTYQCGPAALAIVLQASGVAATPDALVPQVYLPGRKGSLQIEMQGAPRRYDRVSYELDPDLSSITAELDAGRPVVVLHNYGLPFWPRWHYAVVIGYDPLHQKVVLRSGTKRREVQSAAYFMRAWDNGGRWAIVLLRPGELPAGADRARYLEAASAFERAAAPASARKAYDSAIKAWPDDPLGWIGRGTANYRDHALAAAVADYRQAVERNPDLPGARNNLAQTLLDLHCGQAARAELSRIDDSTLSVSMRAAVADTRAQLAALQGQGDPPQCAAL